MDFLNKVFKFGGEKIIAGPKRGQKIPDSWMWTSWQTDKDAFYALHYTSDKNMITQIASKNLLTNNIAKIKEVPKEFLYKIIKYEFRS